MGVSLILKQLDRSDKQITYDTNNNILSQKSQTLIFIIHGK